METKKSSEEIEKKATDQQEEEEIWEEVKADDSEKTLKEEDEDEWEEVEEEIEVEVEEEEEEKDEPDPEIEEDPEEDPKEETEEDDDDDDRMKNSPQQINGYYSVARECIIQRQLSSKSNQLLLLSSDQKKEEKDTDDIDPTSSPAPLTSNFIVMPINQRRPTPERRDTNSEEDNQKKNFNDKFCSGGGGGRVWCQEDEITILEGLIEYKNKEGTYPPNDMVDFHEFIKWKLLSSDITRIQTYEKIKRLKRKFFTNLERVEDLVEPVFSKPHDYVLFHLSTKLWGEDCNNNSNNNKTNSRIRRKRKREIVVDVKKRIKKSGKKQQQPNNDNNSSFNEVRKEDVSIMEEEEEEEEDFEMKYPFLSEALRNESSSYEHLADGVKRLLKEKLSSIGSAKAKELEMQWKKIREQESEIFLQKLNLIALQTQLMSKEIKKP